MKNQLIASLILVTSLGAAIAPVQAQEEVQPLQMTCSSERHEFQVENKTSLTISFKVDSGSKGMRDYRIRPGTVQLIRANIDSCEMTSPLISYDYMPRQKGYQAVEFEVGTDNYYVEFSSNNSSIIDYDAY